MKPGCEICRGTGLIRLPIYRRVQAVMSDAVATAPAPAARTFPCPECSGTIPHERLAVVQYHSFVDSRIDDPRLVAHARKTAAYQLVDGLLRGDFIRFERGPKDESEQRYAIVATVGVVSPKHVADLEERVAARQQEVAHEVIDEAAKGIRVWGSYYHGTEGSIQKAQAIGELSKALKRVLAKRSATKVMP